MFSKISKFILSGVIALGVATAAKADTLQNYTFNVKSTIGAPVSAVGYFSVDKQGTISVSDIKDWTLTVTSGNIVLNFDSSNSSLVSTAGTTITATGDELTFLAPTENDGFSLTGSAARSDGAYNFEWNFAFGGPSELMIIFPPNGGSEITGGILLPSFPATFTAGGVSADPSPVPEPSSLLLLGTGTLSAAVGLRRKLKSL